MKAYPVLYTMPRGKETAEQSPKSDPEISHIQGGVPPLSQSQGHNRDRETDRQRDRETETERQTETEKERAARKQHAKLCCHVENFP